MLTAMTAPLPALPAHVPDLDHAVDKVTGLHAELAGVLDRIAAAEDEYMRKVAAAHTSGGWCGSPGWRTCATTGRTPSPSAAS